MEFDSGLPKDSPFVANPTIGIAAANASGKSSLLQALNFMRKYSSRKYSHKVIALRIYMRKSHLM